MKIVGGAHLISDAAPCLKANTEAPGCTSAPPPARLTAIAGDGHPDAGSSTRSARGSLPGDVERTASALFPGE